VAREADYYAVDEAARILGMSPARGADRGCLEATEVEQFALRETLRREKERSEELEAELEAVLPRLAA
jgi:hypothetical protein